MKQILLPAALLFIAAAAYTQSVDKRLRGIEKELEEVLATWHAPGFAVAVVDKDKLIYAKGFGYRDYENKVPVTENTLFAIGSSTKSFTSGLLGILRKEDKLSFDDPPSKHIPGFRFYNSYMDERINIQDILCHRTGLPRHDYSWYFFPTRDRDSLITRIAYQEPTFDIREQWQYNNFMFLTQGVIAEKITGKSWEENIREKFFTPLGMTRSNLSIAELEQATDAAFGYNTSEDDQISRTDYYRILAMAPAGSINSSVKEMASYLQMWINGGKFNGKEILPAEYVKEAMSSHMVVSPGVPEADTPDLQFQTYGYGWFLSSYKGHYRVEHGGNIDGFSANASFYPTDSIGIMVLTNQNGSAIPSIVRNIIADRMLGVEQTDWNKNFKDRLDKQRAAQKETASTAVSNKVEGTSPSHEPEAYTGLFESKAAGKMRVYLNEDSLLAKTSGGRIWLRHYHYDTFEVLLENDGKIDTTASPYRLQFETDPMGKISQLTINLEANIERSVFSRIVEEVVMEEDQMSAYVGEYSISGVRTKFFIKDGSLRLSVPGQPEYELIPVGDHQFKTKGLEGYSVKFSVNGSLAESVDLIQPNGTFKAMRED